MSSVFHRFANPARFMRASDAFLPFLSVAAVLALAIGTVMAFRAPPDYQQGETVRIMFIHVPSATMSMLCYGLIAAASATALIWRHPLAEVAARAAAPLGAGFTLLCLASGSLWGRPMWGTWWVWDARLTSELILFFLYLGYIALANAFDDSARGGRAAAILALVGAINLPIIKFSVVWWNTLHQPASILRFGGPTIDPSILDPLIGMELAFLLGFLALWVVRMRTALIRARIETLRQFAAESAAVEPVYALPV